MDGVAKRTAAVEGRKSLCENQLRECEREKKINVYSSMTSAIDRNSPRTTSKWTFRATHFRNYVSRIRLVYPSPNHHPQQQLKAHFMYNNMCEHKYKIFHHSSVHSIRFLPPHLGQSQQRRRGERERRKVPINSPSIGFALAFMSEGGCEWIVTELLKTNDDRKIAGQILSLIDYN